MLSAVCLMSQPLIVMLSVAFFYCYAERPYAECRYAKCHYAECHCAECRCAPKLPALLRLGLH